MNRRKQNKRLLGLAVLLYGSVLVVSLGSAMARYRTSINNTVTFEVRSPAQICLGIEKTFSTEVENDGETQTVITKSFVPEGELIWSDPDGDGKDQLELAIANGVSDEDFSKRKQQINLRLISSLGAVIPSKAEMPITATDLYLRIPSETEVSGFVEYKASADTIVEGTSLYNDYGEGWVYTFSIEEEELSWVLYGGKLDYITMTLVMDGDVSENSLLSLKVIGTLLE